MGMGLLSGEMRTGLQNLKSRAGTGLPDPSMMPPRPMTGTPTSLFSDLQPGGQLRPQDYGMTMLPPSLVGYGRGGGGSGTPTGIPGIEILSSPYFKKHDQIFANDPLVGGGITRPANPFIGHPLANAYRMLLGAVPGNQLDPMAAAYHALLGRNG